MAVMSCDLQTKFATRHESQALSLQDRSDICVGGELLLASWGVMRDLGRPPLSEAGEGVVSHEQSRQRLRTRRNLVVPRARSSTWRHDEAQGNRCTGKGCVSHWPHQEHDILVACFVLPSWPQQGSRCATPSEIWWRIAPGCFKA